MRRDYDTGTSDESRIFTGVEVEHTMFHGLTTVFIPLDIDVEIPIFQGVEHVYIGANHTFDAEKIKRILLQLSEIREDLKYDVKATVEVPSEKVNYLLEFPTADWICYTVSVKIPNVERLQNIHIKIDDIDFRATNSGVWVVKAEEIMKNKNKTNWDAYTTDTLL